MLTLAQLIAKLEISVPVLLHIQEEDGSHTLHLYGGQVVIVAPGDAATPDLASAAPDLATVVESVDFSVVEGIGAAATAKLHAAGIRTWDDVAAAADSTLRRTLSTYQLAKLRAWYAAHIRKP